MEALITSKTRIRLLVKFFLNPSTSSYLRELSNEFGESSNGIRLELNRMASAGLLETKSGGKMVHYCAHQGHPLFKEIRGLVAKYVGLDRIVEDVVEKLGKVSAAYLIGDYAQGKDTGIIDLLLVGTVDKLYLVNLLERAEDIIRRRIRFLILNAHELNQIIQDKPALLIWTAKP
jgi:hypothetical protein